ncbi:MAG: hypothetical protein LRZ85_00075 [Alphaproteobacteria bacterium]|nr:hypothetical protein [Alphaproteobacteria bacterium]MCD8526556.1 hypothetical protein [Alphaproteobacteria bacterium]MCD8571330.1 hypothetical protein [Alphaproteobacteria bacterium]
MKLPHNSKTAGLIFNLAAGFAIALPLYIQDDIRPLPDHHNVLSRIAVQEAEASLDSRKRNDCISFSDLIGSITICKWQLE